MDIFIGEIYYNVSMEKPEKNGIVHKLLLLVNILINKKLSKTDIISEFQKKNISVSKTSIDKYIRILTDNGFSVKTEKEKGKNIYFLEFDIEKNNLNEESEAVFQELKKIIISQKDYNFVKNSVYMFYKIASCFDKDSISKVANFGYYSTINWFLVNELEKHCYDKDIILIEYILPNATNREITIHADKLSIRGKSARLYLVGAIGNSSCFSNLPVDRIFAIKKVLRKKVCFELPTRFLKYTISKNNFIESGIEDDETLLTIDNDRVTILSPVIDEFLIAQRILYHCPEVYYISDEKIKSIVFEKLKKLEEIYGK